MHEDRLKRICFVIALVGIFLLLVLSRFNSYKEVTTLENLKIKSFVKTSGVLTKVNQYGTFFVGVLENNITLTCTKCNLVKNSSIFVYGQVEQYNSQKQINAWRIEQYD